MFDPLVLPISTGIEEDRRNALETIEGTRLISQGAAEVPHGRRPVERQLRPQARGAGGAEQRVPARAARGRARPARSSTRQQDPPAEPHSRRAVERRAGSDLRPPARGIRSAHALHRAVPRRREGRGRHFVSICSIIFLMTGTKR